MSTKNLDLPQANEEDCRRQPARARRAKRASQTITAAVAEGGRNGEVRQAGTITNDLHALEKLLRRIRGEREHTLHVCYSRSLGRG